MKKSIFLFFAAFLCSVSAWADVTWKGGYFYFDNSLDVNKGYVMLCGRRHKENGNDNWYTAVTTFDKTAITGTKLYYTKTLVGSTWSTSTWNGWAVISDASQWNNNNFDNWGDAGWCSAYNNSQGFNGTSTYLLKPTSTSKSKTVNVSTLTDYKGLNKTQTVHKYTSTDNGVSYSNTNVNSGTVTISAYKMTGNGTASNSGNTATIDASSTSKSIDAVYTSEVTLHAAASDGYKFNGWYDVASGGSAISTNPTYTYTATTSSKTIYARFVQTAEETHDVTVSYKHKETTIKTGTTIEKVGVETSTTVNAPEIPGYNFVNWTKGSGVNYATGDEKSQSIEITTNTSGEYTLTANYIPETVYFVNTAEWSDVKVYAWGDGSLKNADWPGEALTPTGEKIGGFDVYKYTSGAGYKNVIFNGKSGQTPDLAWTDGKYYVYNSENSISADDWYEKAAAEGVLPRYKTIYLNTGGSSLWNQEDAKFFVHVWGGVADGIDTQMKHLENDIYQVEIAASQDKIIFLRQSKETSGVVWSDAEGLYNKTANLDIPADKNCYTKTDWGENDGTWSTLDYYVTGNSALVGGDGWKANEVKMTAGEGTWSHTFSALAAGIEYQFKVTRNGTWDKAWNYDNLSTPIAEENVLKCKDNNIGFVLANTGDVTITFDGNKISLSTTSTFAVPTYTIVGAESLTGHNWSVDAVDNNMTQDPVKKNIFTLTKDVTLAAGDYQYKAVRNHSYDWSVPDGVNNKTLNVAESGTGTITYTLDVEKFELSAALSNWTAVVVAQDVKLSYNEGLVPFEEADDHKTTSVSVDLDANKVYTFNIVVNDTYMYNEGNMWRGNCTDWTFENANIGEEAHITTDLAGKHTFTYTYETNTLTVTYPDGTNVPAPVFLGGGMNGWNWINTRLLPALDGKTATVTIPLTVGTTTEFKIKEGDTMYGNDGTIDRTFHSDFIFSEKKQDSEDAQENAKIYADATGNYTFTWDYENNTLSVEYPDLYTYVLMGVDNDWDNGIKMVHNESNTTQEEYMLTCQTISIFDAIKVVKIVNGEKAAYCGTAEYNQDFDNFIKNDDEGNIVLQDGIYNFYFKPAEDEGRGKIWIENATDCPEEIDLEVTDLTIEESTLSGTAGVNPMTFVLTLVNYDESYKEYTLSGESIVKYGARGRFSSTVTGSLTKSYDADLGTDVFAGVVYATMDEINYKINLTMYNYVASEEILGEATTTLDGSDLTMVLDWDGTPITIVLPEFDATGAKEYGEIMMEIGSGDDAYYAFGEPTVTVEDGEVFVDGEFYSYFTDMSYIVYVWGTLPVATPTITLTDGDNSSVIAANEGKVVNVELQRSFVEKTGYYTLCVPFDMDADIIGTAYELGDITGNVAGGGININLNKVSTIKAGVPYLVNPKTLTNPVIEGVTIVNTTGTSNTVTGANTKITFTGIINGTGEQTNGSTEYYVGNNGYLYHGTVDKLGLRAFLTITDDGGSPISNLRARVVAKEDEATGVDNITAPEGQVLKLIENGQLIIIRGGEKYNVQGQRL